jgi:hypothetical protein
VARESSEARTWRIDPFEAFLLVAFAAVSCWVLGLDLYQVIANGRVWTGTDGFFITDQMQYLAWIQSAAHHGLISDMFVLRGTPADYFQPAVVISGGLVDIGMSPWLSLLLWKPVAVLVTFFGIRAYVYHSIHGTRARRTAIALGLFYGSFTVIYGGVSVIGDMFPGFLVWGYPFGLIALGMALYALVLYDRARKQGRISYMPALLGLVASSLHPWQGETLILIVVLAELLRLKSDGLQRRTVEMVVITALGTALPLLYYLILGKADPAWGFARDASKHNFPLWSILLVLAPVAPLALLGYRGRSTGFWQTSVRVFPLVTLIVYGFSASGASATPLHAFQGITVPVGVLAVQGLATTPWHRFRYRRIVGAVALALATIPATVWEMRLAPEYMGPATGNSNFIQPGERDALTYLSHDSAPGGVLSRGYLGLTVPARTDRQTYLGDCLWSQPNCSLRSEQTNHLFLGQMTASQARAFVTQTHARFLLADCKTSALVAGQIKPLVARTTQFGCATVYELKPAASGTAALAESPEHAAAVRTPRRK